MEQQSQKKVWRTPELIVLVRSKPEEAVLAACKAWLTTSGPFATQVWCVYDTGAGCGACNSDAPS